ncbi:hypothetical protein GCM10028827_43570 [Mucilaginibacter myungsuensis]
MIRMRVLLDTHSLIWFTEDDKRLSKKAAEIIANAENERFYQHCIAMGDHDKVNQEKAWL